METPPQPRRSTRAPLIIGFVAGVAVIVAIGALAAWRLNWFAVARASDVSDNRPDSRFSAQELRGRTVYYVTANCASCHGGPTGGDMMDYPPKHNSNGHTWHHPQCELKQIIRDGGDEMTAGMRDMMAPPGAPKMPAFKDKLSDADIDAVLAYIKTMWYAGQRELQAVATHESCTT